MPYELSHFLENTFWQDLVTNLEAVYDDHKPRLLALNIPSLFSLEIEEIRAPSKRSKKDPFLSKRPITNEEMKKILIGWKSKDFEESPFLFRETLEAWRKKINVKILALTDIISSVSFGPFGNFRMQGKDYFLEYGLQLEAKSAYMEAIPYYQLSRSPKAFFSIGKLFTDGKVGSVEGRPNYPEGIKWLEASNSDIAYYNIGQLYKNGQGDLIKQDPDFIKAEDYFNKATSTNIYVTDLAFSKNAYLEMAFLELEDHLGPINYGRVLERLVLADTPFAQATIGMLYVKGHLDSTLRDPEQERVIKAEEIIEKSNSAQGFHELAKFYGQKDCPSSNYKKAAHYLEKAGKLGHLEAYVDLAYLHKEGLLGPVNMSKVEHFLRKAKTPTAYRLLARSYLEGHLEPQLSQKERFKKSIQLLEQAQDPDSLCDIGYFYLWRYPGANSDTSHYKLAADFFMRSKTKEALYALANMYYRGYVGSGLDKDARYKRAADLYVESGTPDALCGLAGMIEFGCIDTIEGLPNLKKAESLYRQSGTALAWTNLLYIHAENTLGGIEWGSKKRHKERDSNLDFSYSGAFRDDFKKAMASFRAERYPLGYFLICTLCEKNSEILGLEEGELLQLRQEAKEGLLQCLEEGSDLGRKAYFQGKLAFLEKNLEEALACFQKAHFLGYQRRMELRDEDLTDLIGETQQILALEKEMVSLDTEEDEDLAEVGIEKQLSRDILEQYSESEEEGGYRVMESPEGEELGAESSDEDVAHSGRAMSLAKGDDTIVAGPVLEETDQEQPMASGSSRKESKKNLDQKERRRRRLAADIERSHKRMLSWKKAQENSAKKVMEKAFESLMAEGPDGAAEQEKVVHYQNNKVKSLCHGEYKQEIDQFIDSIRAGMLPDVGRPEMLKSLWCVDSSDSSNKKYRVYSVRMTRGDRIVFAFIPRGVLIIDVGGHYDGLKKV